MAFSRIAVCILALAAARLCCAESSAYTATYSSYLGGSAAEQVTAMAIDAAGNVYLAGFTESMDFPVPSLRSRSGGAEAFVLKINPAVPGIVWATVLGGSGYDQANAIAVDALGAVTITGLTNSVDFPVLNAHRNAAQGGSSDGFLARFDTNGNLVFSTYIGGIGTDQAYGLAVNASNEIWVVGETSSYNFPLLNQQQALCRSGSDAFAMRFNSAGVLLSSTCLGGTGTDVARAVALDSTGQAYITGTTDSTDFPLVGPFQAVRAAGGPDAFILKLSADGRTLRYSSYLGGPAGEVESYESGTAVAVDSTGAAYVLGTTSSYSFPLVAPLQAAHGGDVIDAFLAKVSPAGNSLVFSSYMGGDGRDEGGALALHADGSLSVGITTASVDLPQTGSMSGPKYPYDGFLWKLNPQLNKAVISTYIAGSGSDILTAIALRGSDVYLAGGTASPNLLPSGTQKGLFDAYLLRLQEQPLAVQFTPAQSAVPYTVSGTGCSPGTYTGLKVLQWTHGAACTVAPTTLQYSGDRRWRFTTWHDGSTANPRVFEASPGSTLFSMNFGTEYLVTRTVSPAGAGTVSFSPDASDGWYAASTGITMTATASSGYKFSHWSGSSTSTAAVISPVISAAGAYTANFTCVFGLGATSASFSDAAAEGTVQVTAGTGCNWSAASNAAWLTVTSGASGSGAGTIRFQVAANPSGTQRSGTLTIAGNTFTVTQGGVPNVSVTIATSPAGLAWTVSGQNCAAGSYTGQQTLSWLRGAQCTVTMTAVQASGDTRRVFTQWSDSQGANPRVLSATTNTSWTGFFRTDHRVQLSVAPSQSGTVSTVPVSADGFFPEGTSVQFSASPASGYSFSGWSGGLSGATTSVSKAITAPLAASAAFALVPVCTYQLAKTALTVPVTGDLQTVTLTTSAPSCAWTASSSAAWAQVYPLNGAGNASFDIRTYPNLTTKTRTASVVIAGRTVTLTQSQSTTGYEERFASQMYFNFLGRIPSPSEVAFHAGTLRKGLSPGQLVVNFFNTEEFNLGGRFIAGLYVGLLNRDAEFGGWLFQRNAMATGQVNQTELVRNFIGSGEYKTKFGDPSNEEYVRLLYRYVLLREASPAEVAFQASHLTDQASRTRMASGFLNSDEFRKGTGPRLTAFLLHSCLLLRDASAQELTNTAASIAAGTSVRTLIDGILASPEFAQLLQ